MKKQLVNRILAGTLAAGMIAATACGTTDSADTTTKAADTEAADTEAGDTEAEDTEAADTEDLFANAITVTCFGQGPSDTGINDWNENAFFQALKEKTNVTIDWTNPIYGSEQTDFDLMLSGGEYYDMFWSNAASYADGDDAAVDDGVYLDLTSYVEQYMPNYWAAINSDEDLKRDAYTDEGRIVGIKSLLYNGKTKEYEAQAPFGGLCIRGDWLEELGYEVPTTYDELEEILLAFKEQKGAAQPIYYPGDGYFSLFQFSSGFGALSTFQVDEDGNVSYGPATEGWKEFLKEMHSWYEEGIIGAEYVANNAMGWDTAPMISGESGAALATFTLYDIYEMAVEGMNVQAVPLLTVNEGETAEGLAKASKTGSRFYLSAQIDEEKIPQVLAMIDYLYSEEGAMLGAYGVEGDTYTVNDDGTYSFTDKILNNPDYETSSVAMDTLLCPMNLQARQDWTREYIGIPEGEQAMLDVFAEGGDALSYPSNCTMDSDESQQYSAVFTDCESYMKEMLAKFIMGTADIDAEWDSYIETLNKYGLQDAIDAKQSAYDRYMAK